MMARYPATLAIELSTSIFWARVMRGTISRLIALNFRAVPSLAADALHGGGVFETLKAISESVLRRLAAGGPVG